MKRMLVFLLLTLLKVGVLCSQTIMIVDIIDGVEQNIELSTASKISFQTDSIVILPRTGDATTMIYAITDIRKLAFDGSIVTGLDTVEQPRVTIYPNPVSDYFMINGIQKGNLPLKVFSLNGRVVIRGRYRYGSRVDVSSLASGLYLIQVGGDNCKFVKK